MGQNSLRKNKFQGISAKRRRTKRRRTKKIKGRRKRRRKDF